MKKILFVAAVLFAALAVSCEKKALEEPVAKGFRTFTCTFADFADSKVSISSSGKTAWEAGDEILVHAGSGGGDFVTVTLAAADISADGKTATINVPDDLEPYNREDYGYQSKFYAIYPAAAASTEHSMYYETRVNEFSEPFMGAYDDGNGKFVFKNLSGVISFTLSADVDSYEFSGNNGETVAYYPDYQCRYALKLDNTVDYRRTSNNGASSTASKIAKGSVVADGSTVNYICIPEGANLTGGFTIKFFKGEEFVKIAKSVAPVNIACGSLLPLGDISSRAKDYVPPTTSDHKSTISGATDLSADKGPANCYVISAAGAYKFPVVKGNSSEAPGTVFGVELLWETYNSEEEVQAGSVIAEVDYDGPENYVYFKTPDTLKPGNALIAARDAQDKIIWSWHIWIPETAFTVSDFGISSVALMSRNLGALVDTQAGEADADPRSYGLFYQWGRKDPFLGAKRFKSSSQALVSGAEKSVSAEQFTVAQSIQNPTTYVAFKGDWMTPEDRTLWTETGEKSIYDPCPAGYRVPARNSEDALWSDVTALDASFGWTPNDTYGWFKLGTAVFPFAGYIDYDGGGVAHSYDRTRIWNAHKSTEAYAYDQQIWFDATDGWTSKPSWQHRTACGNSVRCAVDWN